MILNLSNNQKIDTRVVVVGRYLTNNPEISIKEAAEYFSKNFFEINEITVDDYLKEYNKLLENNPDIIGQINETMENGKLENVDDEKVRQRVILACKMFMQDYMTMEKIAQELNENYWTIYFDLTQRLEIVNPMLSKMVTAQLKNNSVSSLKSNNK